MSQRLHHGAARAFTIIEVLVVAIIIAIMAASATNLFTSGRYERLQAAVQLVRSDMDWARSASLSSPTDPIILKIRNDGSGYFLAKASAPTTALTGANGPLSLTFGTGRGECAEGVTLGVVSGVGTVQFGPFGGVADPVPTLRFTLSDGDEQARMLLDPFTGDPTIIYEN